jgi:hypothetical protein
VWCFLPRQIAFGLHALTWLVAPRILNVLTHRKWQARVVPDGFMGLSTAGLDRHIAPPALVIDLM